MKTKKQAQYVEEFEEQRKTSKRILESIFSKDLEIIRNIKKKNNELYNTGNLNLVKDVIENLGSLYPNRNLPLIIKKKFDGDYINYEGVYYSKNLFNIIKEKETKKSGTPLALIQNFSLNDIRRTLNIYTSFVSVLDKETKIERFVKEDENSPLFKVGFLKDSDFNPDLSISFNFEVGFISKISNIHNQKDLKERDKLSRYKSIYETGIKEYPISWLNRYLVIGK